MARAIKVLLASLRLHISKREKKKKKKRKKKASYQVVD